MREIHELLNRRWVIRKQDPDLYFRLKDKYEQYKPFFQDKCGYQIVMNPMMIKVEKIPGKVASWMGITQFNDVLDYQMLLVILMFLEDMENEEQFVLSQVTDYLSNHMPKMVTLDWTQFMHRKSLIRVLRYCVEEGMILLNDGDDTGFSSSAESTEVLYENTGLSKYFMRRFNFDITTVKQHKMLEQMEWQVDDRDRGLIRRHRVYRKLIMSPISYQENDDDQDYLYIKNQRSVIENDMDKYLEAHFHLHRQGALVMIPEHIHMSHYFPDRKNLSDIVLQFCSLIQEQLKEDVLKREADDSIRVSTTWWYQGITQLIEEMSHGWSKKYREDSSASQLSKELLRLMIDYGMVIEEKETNEMVLMPVIGKMVGYYPKGYLAKRKEGEEHGAVED